MQPDWLQYSKNTWGVNGEIAKLEALFQRVPWHDIRYYASWLQHMDLIKTDLVGKTEQKIDDEMNAPYTEHAILRLAALQFLKVSRESRELMAADLRALTDEGKSTYEPIVMGYEWNCDTPEHPKTCVIQQLGQQIFFNVLAIELLPKIQSALSEQGAACSSFLEERITAAQYLALIELTVLPKLSPQTAGLLRSQAALAGQRYADLVIKMVN